MKILTVKEEDAKRSIFFYKCKGETGVTEYSETLSQVNNETLESPKFCTLKHLKGLKRVTIQPSLEPKGVRFDCVLIMFRSFITVLKPVTF